LKRLKESKRFENIVDSFKDSRVLVIGDIMMDEYIWGKVSRISPEAPVPVVDVSKVSHLLGGAANVANNIYSLGGEVFISGIIGDDGIGGEVVGLLKEKGIDVNGIIVDNSRPTTLKTRIVAHNQQVVRFDIEKRDKIGNKIKNKILRYCTDIIPECDAVIISDYGKGVISRSLLSFITNMTGETGKILAVDPKIDNFLYYRNATILTPNKLEASQSLKMDIRNESDLICVGKKLLSVLKARSLLITRGEEGMTLFEDNGEITNIPTIAKKVFDVTGAGDTVISVVTLSLISGSSFKESAILSNYAAGIVVGEVGTATVDPVSLKRIIKDEHPTSSSEC
jgi:D-beta-D-heptose 7-phosphate kinase/D-beta-D-heptose 1-phosphate adenosyltransferase